MESTPTGIPPGMSGQGYQLRRRIVEAQDEEITKKQKTKVPKQKEAHGEIPDSSYTELKVSAEDSHDSSSDTVIFDKERYNLRSSESDLLDKTVADASSFYKSVMTPSRLKGRNNKSLGRSFLFRTPCIKSAKKIYNVRGAKSIPRAVKLTWEENMREILNKFWKVCYLSAMFGFYYTKKNLKNSYLRALKIKILDVYPSYKLTVTITPSTFIRQNVNRADSLFLVVTSLSFPKEDQEEILTTVYEALLIRSENHQSVPLQGTDWFPLMLYSGNEIIHNAVISWLQASFGCYITPKGINLKSLLWLTASWCHGICLNPRHYSREDRVVTFRYEARPPKLKDVSLSSNNLSLKLSIKVNTIFQLWERIIEANQLQLKLEQVTRFHCALDSLVENLTHIPKDLLTLMEVQTACNTISSSGKIRLTCDKSFTSLFQHLIELFEDVCNFNIILEEEEEVEESAVQG